MEKDILHREEELYSMTSTTRCLSCGQLPKESWQSSNHPTIGSANSKAHTASRQNRYPSAASPSSSSIMTRSNLDNPHYDDELSTIHSVDMSVGYEGNNNGLGGQGQGGMRPNTTTFVTSDALAVNPYSLNSSEQVYSLLTGQAGLKPLQLHHAPMVPVNRPHTTTNSVSGSSVSSSSSMATDKKKKNGDKIPDHLHRKAKLKEAVKILAPAVEQYGYSQSNPLYVLEGAVSDDNDDNSSIDSLTSLNTRGSQLIGSHSLTSIQKNKQLLGEFTMINDPRASTATGGKTKNGSSHPSSASNDVLVLPDIRSSSEEAGGSRGTMSTATGGNRRRVAGKQALSSSAPHDQPQVVVSQMKLSSYV
jgi:hypothetical protein